MKITPIQLAKRVERWGKRLAPLGVAHFEFTVTTCDEVPPDGSGQAAAWVSSDYDAVKFYFQNDYVEESSEDQLDQTIVHEWLHIAMRDFDNVTELVETWMPEATYTQWEQMLKHEREGVVDRIATLIVQLHGGSPAPFTP